MIFIKTAEPKYSTLVILDRDGTLNFDAGYTFSKSNLQLTSFAVELKSLIKKYNFAATIVTNQSGIGRNLYNTNEFSEFTLELIKKIDPSLSSFCGVFACPHKPTDYCQCRKPKNKMLLESKNLGEFKRIIMVGNSESDHVAAQTSGILYIDCNSKLAAFELENWLRNDC